jgi:predicted double-glycine peptidase
MDNFIVSMMAKADELTDFQTAFLDMARYINERGLVEDFMKYLENRDQQ